VNLRKPETLVIIAAIAGTVVVLALFIAELLVNRQRDLNEGERRLRHFNIMMVEHTARNFEAVDIHLRETASDLSRNQPKWPAWSSEKTWEYLARQHSNVMPQLDALLLFQTDGELRAQSNTFPPAPLNVGQRPDFLQLSEGLSIMRFGPFLDRSTGTYSYGVSRRVEDDNGRFVGMIHGAINPAYLQEFCWPSRLADDFEAVLINRDDQIIASCRPADLSQQSAIIGKPVRMALYAGELGELQGDTGVQRTNGYMVAIESVPGANDLRMLSAIPEQRLLAAWQRRLLELGVLAVFIVMLILLGSVLVRRQFLDMGALTAALQANRATLAENVRLATAEVAAQRDEAERANKAKSRFLAAASHDLRQPLHALSLFAADLQHQMRSGNTAEAPRLAEQIAASAALLSELLDALLDLSRLDVSGVNPEVRSFALQPLLGRLTLSQRRNAAAKQLRLRIRPSKLWVKSDPVMLERMLGNLLSNAIRYTPAGGRILVAARQRGGAVRIEVRDSGMGIAREHQSAIFNEFYQIGNEAREQNKGLGLGLAIVDRLAKALGIQVDVASEPNRGTRFSLTVTGSPAQAEEALTDRHAPPTAHLHFIGRSEALQGIIALVEAWDYTVTAQPDLAEKLPSQSGKRLVLIDANLVDDLLAQHPDVHPVLVITSQDEATNLPDHVVRLTPPIRPAKLRALLNQLQKTSSKSNP
jgi:signal transduction histidine kinase